jgi:hypothetical protein
MAKKTVQITDNRKEQCFGFELFFVVFCTDLSNVAHSPLVVQSEQSLGKRWLHLPEIIMSKRIQAGELQQSPAPVQCCACLYSCHKTQKSDAVAMLEVTESSDAQHRKWFQAAICCAAGRPTRYPLAAELKNRFITPPNPLELLALCLIFFVGCWLSPWKLI